MTPLRARFAVLAVTAVCVATATNALFLQKHPAPSAGRQAGPTTSVSITHFPDKLSPSQPLNTPSENPKPLDNTPRLQAAVLRELARKGYGKTDPKPNMRAIVLAYEFDTGLPLTGEPTDFLFKRLIFDLNPAPKGNFADRAEADVKLVAEVQKTLLELGFFSGVLSGRIDVWTENAIKAFERHREITITGRLTENTLLELILYSGQPLRRVAG